MSMQQMHETGGYFIERTFLKNRVCLFGTMVMAAAARLAVLMMMVTVVMATAAELAVLMMMVTVVMAAAAGLAVSMRVSVIVAAATRMVCIHINMFLSCIVF